MVNPGKNLTLDLNGRTLSQSQDGKAYALWIKEGANLTLTGEEGKVDKIIYNFGSLTVGGNITVKVSGQYGIQNFGAELLCIEGGDMDWVYADEDTQKVEIGGGEIYSILSYADEYEVKGGNIQTSDNNGGKRLCISGGQIGTLNVPASCEELKISGEPQIEKIVLAKDMPITAEEDYNPQEQITIALADEDYRYSR